MGGSLTPEQRLNAYVQSIASRPDLPAFSHQIHEILSLVSDDDASLWRLTGLLLKNFSLTAKVLRTANSLYYNHAGRPILSVSHAVAFLGWNTIRDLAAGMLLFEHFRKQKNLPGLEELMLCSLLTASHARETAARVRYPRMEEAYLCGMFRNLGEVLVAAYLPDHYRQILRGIKAHQWAENQACGRVLGFDYEDLGRAILRYWNLPEKVGIGMVAGALNYENLADESDLLRAITEFSHSLTDAVYRGNPADSPTRVQALIQKFGKALSLNQESVGEILNGAASETKATFDAAYVPFDRLRLDHQIEIAMRSPDLSVGDEGTAGGAAPAKPLERELAALAAEVDRVVESAADFDLNDIFYMILEAIYRTGRFDRALLCLVTPDRTLVEARLGVGDNVDALLDGFRLPLSVRSGPVAAALIGRQDLFVDTREDGRYESSGLQRLSQAAYFGLLPIVVDRLAVGCLYFDRVAPAPPPGSGEKAQLAALRDAATRALIRKRNMHAPGAGGAW